jgi:hypothetical protein
MFDHALTYEINDKLQELWLMGGRTEDFVIYVNTSGNANMARNKKSIWRSDFGMIEIRYNHFKIRNNIMLIPREYVFDKEKCHCCGQELPCKE